ncbi:hypothetical protein RMS29_027545 (plasmid) [Agrobacterium rosae]|uniref:Uncharacterized protein n=1 Tax=Agrobacterium rosae TaxID=1972867 RepID=A0AAW9FPU3_9HYPH|nr:MULTISPECIES: hypothetical protein [Agrobacterium]MCF1501572.1 hypothetical protein [Allorhizobium sp. Av2]MDX8321708.1 hypothetical protein [Agrobacterium sp. rho-8.1]MDX8305171.1 hypothetical protein [Agrobacterium rosae]MDX8311455.1 hypothetical protein [Agrobacterium sp. rho-13.3]MDX8316313.1 hypothetical protein [Agrobacterium rosae]
MARIMRSSNSDGRLLDAQREHAAQTFLSHHPDIARDLSSRRQDDLYTSIANHISMTGDPGRRQLLTVGLRQEFEKAQSNIIEVTNARPQPAGRFIHDARPDPEKLLAELYENTHRDASSRPLGNVAGHAQERLAATYAALKLVEVARDQGLLPENPTLIATKAMVQDKRTSQEFPAAHRMPGDLAIQNEDGSTTRLTDVFKVDLNKVAIDREVFATTDRVNRLVNVADGWAENAGMKTALALAATEVARGASAGSAMKDIIEPGYADAVKAAYSKVEMNFTVAEQQIVGGAILDARTMQPIRGVIENLKLSSTDQEARAHAKELIRLTLHTYSKETELGEEQQLRIDNLIEGIKDNETKLGAFSENAVDPKRAITEQGFYRQRGLQAYEDLMGPIEKLANEAMAASVKAEKTVNDPHATDGQIRASFAAVDGYKQAIGRSLESMEGKINDQLSSQFRDEGIKVSTADVAAISKSVLDSVKLPPKLQEFERYSRHIDYLKRDYTNERIENGPRAVDEPSKNAEVSVEIDHDPRP